VVPSESVSLDFVQELKSLNLSGCTWESEGGRV
jgi:hypothetical protein